MEKQLIVLDFNDNVEIKEAKNNLQDYFKDCAALIIKAEQFTEDLKAISKFVKENLEKLTLVFRSGESNVKEILQYADSVVIIEKDQISSAIRAVEHIIAIRGAINLDISDLTFVLKGGVVHFATGIADGENRVETAVERALEKCNAKNAARFLINIESSEDKKTIMREVRFINDHIQAAAGDQSDLIWGTSFDNTLGESIRVNIFCCKWLTENNYE